MANENKLKPEPDAVYRINTWFWKFTDIFWNPRRHLGNIPLKEGMVVVDYGCGPGHYTLPISKLVGPKGKVSAVDIQPLAIKTVKEKAAKQGLTNIEAIMVNSYNTAIPQFSNSRFVSHCIFLILLIEFLVLHYVCSKYKMFKIQITKLLYFKFHDGNHRKGYTPQ